MGIEITPRCRYLRTLLSEYSRIVDHLTCVAAGLMELGAMTAFLYLVMIRDYMYEHLADLTGARVTYTYGRIGGLARDLPAGWLKRLGEILDQYEDFVGRVHGLVDRNRIFIDRMRNVGTITTAEAINWGYTGPILRSTGAPRDLRKDTPYLAYAELDFEVPVGIKGDNYDRYYVRMREMDESVWMIRQLIDMLPEGPINVDDRRCVLPDKSLVYTEIESLINHFKVIMDGPKVPAGDVYSAHESPNGELGFYLVSTGEGTPWKVHVRAPSFVHMGGVHRMLDGFQLADIVPTFGSINMIGGECDTDEAPDPRIREVEGALSRGLRVLARDALRAPDPGGSRLRRRQPTSTASSSISAYRASRSRKFSRSIRNSGASPSAAGTSSAAAT